MNVVMTGAGAFVEVQGTAEQTPFSKERLDELLALAGAGIAPAHRAPSTAPARRVARPPSPSEPRLVLATANRAKAREMAALLAGVGVRILDLADFPGVTLPPEGETSYADNAPGKARAVGRGHRGFLSLADDSGIEVDALGGRPGVRSARFGGEDLDDAGRNVEMLRVLDGVPPERRTARYRALIALSEPGGRRQAVTEGVVEGILLTAPAGGGFGYDPLFFYPPLDATFAEVPAAAKHAVSHRALAMAGARLILAEWLRRGEGRRGRRAPPGILV